MREGGGSCEAQAVAVAEAILINRRSSFFATFAFFAAKHQSRVGSFSVERGNAFNRPIHYGGCLDNVA